MELWFFLFLVPILSSLKQFHFFWWVSSVNCFLWQQSWIRIAKILFLQIFIFFYNTNSFWFPYLYTWFSKCFAFDLISLPFCLFNEGELLDQFHRRLGFRGLIWLRGLRSPILILLGLFMVTRSMCLCLLFYHFHFSSLCSKWIFQV